MSESVKQPNLTQKFPLTGRPAGLMAALVAQLADHLPRLRAYRG
jgi:hypothetical protein